MGVNSGCGTEYYSARLPPLGWQILVPLVVLTMPSSGSADLDIRAKDGQLTLRAHTVPLVEVLERLSRETGLKVVYEGRRPSALVTADIEGVSETEALSRLLEGLGVNYAFQADASGHRVELLIISDNSSPGPSVASSGTPSRGRPFPERSLQPPEPEPPPALAEDTGESLDSPEAEPGMEILAADFVPEGAEMAPPSFPSEASYPAPPEPFPTFPAYASYPPEAQPPFD